MFRYLMPAADVAEYLECSPRELASWRKEGSGPRFVKLSGEFYYPYTTELLALRRHRREMRSLARRVSAMARKRPRSSSRGLQRRRLLPRWWRYR
jgi:hypothetical protein